MTRRAALLVLAGAPFGRAQSPNDGLRRRWNDFAKLANKWTAREKQGVFDVKLARQMSEAFRKLENCGEWPK